MSGALDSYSAEDLRLIERMKADDAAIEAGEPQEPQQQQPAEQPRDRQRRDDLPPDDEPNLLPPLPESAQRDEPQSREEPLATEGPNDPRALHEERRRRRELQDKYNELQTKHAADMARLDERLQLITNAAQQHYQQTMQPQQQAPAAQAQPEPMPDFATDPAGYIQAGFRRMDERLAQYERATQGLTAAQNQQLQAQQAQAQLAQLGNWAQAHENDFRGRQPDYDEAVGYLRDARVRMIQAMGHRDPVRIRNQLTDDVRQLAAMTQAQGGNFAEVMYNLAQAHGYQPGQRRQAPQQQAAAALPAPPVPAATAAERLVRGNEMATTIGSTGSAARGEPTAERIANMSEKEFGAYLQQVSKQGGNAMKQLFGS